MAPPNPGQTSAGDTPCPNHGTRRVGGRGTKEAQLVMLQRVGEQDSRLAA